MNMPPILGRAISAQMYSPSWDSAKGIGSNLLSNAQGVLSRGRDMANEAYAVKNMATVNQADRMRRMQEFLAHGDTTVADPVDRLLFTRMFLPR